MSPLIIIFMIKLLIDTIISRLSSKYELIKLSRMERIITNSQKFSSGENVYQFHHLVLLAKTLFCKFFVGEILLPSTNCCRTHGFWSWACWSCGISPVPPILAERQTVNFLCINSDIVYNFIMNSSQMLIADVMINMPVYRY